VRVVAADGQDRLRELHEKGLVTWVQRTFRPDDLDGVTLVVALDREQAVNEAVFAAANERGVLCNVIDQPSRCHFYYPATVRRGNLQIAISTNGLSPALASSIRAELEERFSPLYAEWLERIGKVRSKLLRSRPKSHARTQLLQRLASRSRFERFARQRAQSEKGIS
jgi:precorrin-2 dehydrogenase/sirohydrochlorin ferrochelatase